MRHASESSTSCPSISASKKINQTQTSTLGTNTWGLSIDGGSNYLTLPNGPVVPYDEVFGKVVDAWGVIFNLARDLSIDMDGEEFGLTFFKSALSIPPGTSDYDILIIVMNMINSEMVGLFDIPPFTQDDIDELYPEYTYAQIAWMFMAKVYMVSMGMDFVMPNSNIAELREKLDLPEGTDDSRVIAQALNILRVAGVIPMSSTQAQDIFRQYRQMLTIKTKNSNVMNDLTTITAGVRVDHSMLVGNYATQVMFTAIPNDRPVAVINKLAKPIPIDEGVLLSFSGVNLNYLYKINIGRNANIPCNNLNIINNTTATCILISEDIDELINISTADLGEYIHCVVPISVFGDNTGLLCSAYYDTEPN